MALTSGQVAFAAKVNVETIRYYERRGLFPTARRSPSEYRQYEQEAVTRLRFIKHAQELGFSLKEVEELLALRVRRTAACDAFGARARKKIALVERKIVDLRRIKRTLEHLLAACAAKRATDVCPILDALEEVSDAVSDH